MIALRRPLAFATLGSVAAMLPAGGASGQVTTIPALTATVGGAYSTNPFLSIDGEDSASVQLDIQPSLTLIDGTEQAVITARYNRADYLTRYGSNSGYGATVTGSTRPNARTSLGFNAAYDSQILGAQNGFITPATPVVTTPVTDTDPVSGGTVVTTPIANVPVVTTPGVGTGLIGIDGDIGLIGLRQRRNSLSAGANASFQPDTLSTWNAGITALRSSYPGGSLGALVAANFTNYGANFGYNRSLSEISSIGFQLNANYVKYDGGLDSQVYTPRLTYNRTLSERWTLAAAVGAGITHDDGGTNVSVSVDGSLCRSGDRMQGCITASRVPSVSGFGGVRVQTSLGATFSYQIDQNLSAAASANYSHIGGAQSEFAPGLTVDGQNLVVGDVTLQRRLGRRLSAVGSVSYRNAGGIGANIPGDVTGRLGLSLAVGGR